MLSDLRLHNFRCFDNAAVEMGPGTTLFLGGNGEGKTALLEAACVLLRLQSQRSATLGPIVQIGKKSFRVHGTLAAHQLEFRYGESQRRVTFDHIQQRSLGEYLRLARVVSFANADIELVRGTSDVRRRYLDFLGAQMNSDYRPALRSYERALRARNALLKSALPRPRERAAYDLPLVQHGSRLLQMRDEMVSLLAPFAAAAYAQISLSREKLELRYRPGAGKDFARELAQSRAEESRLRQTIVGPHRDDLALSLDEMTAAHFASEGQQRSIALALKIAQAAAFKALADEDPLLLIDDIFGELDLARREALLANLPLGSQRLITATAMPPLTEMPATATYYLRDRRLMRNK